MMHTDEWRMVKFHMKVMRNIFEKRSLVLFISMLALTALVLLASGLEHVSFEEPKAISLAEAAPGQGVDSQIGPQFLNISWRLEIGLFISLLMLFGLIGLLVSVEARKRFLRTLLNIAFTYWVLRYVMRNYSEMITLFNPASGAEFGAANVANDIVVEPSIFIPPQQSPLISYLISIIIVLAMVYIFWRLYSYWKILQPQQSRYVLENIARITRLSLKEISDGGDSSDVVMNCYRRMSEAVMDNKNVFRDISMTPLEFAHRLERAGLPREAVRNLTQLFESVRYGGRKAGPRETNEAVACLTTILHYCGENV